MRKGCVALYSPRRKFAQVTRTTNTAVDATLRLDTQDLVAAGLGASAGGRLEAVKVRADDPFSRRIRFTSPDQVDGEVLEILATALEQNR